MKRMACITLAIALGLSAGACKKAHKAGNDSMKVTHGVVQARAPVFPALPPAAVSAHRQ